MTAVHIGAPAACLHRNPITRELDTASPREWRGTDRVAMTFQRAGPSGRSSRPSAGALRFAAGRSSPVTGGRRHRKHHVATRGVEAAGQRVEQRHRPRRLRRVGVLLVAAPGVVGNRAGVPDQARGPLDLSTAIQQIASTSSGG